MTDLPNQLLTLLKNIIPTLEEAAKFQRVNYEWHIQFGKKAELPVYEALAIKKEAEFAKALELIRELSA